MGPVRRKEVRLSALLTALCVSLCLHAEPGEAGPIEALTNPDASLSLVLYDDPCRLTRYIELPYRAVHTLNGKVTEGCWRPHFGIVLLYYKDRTLGAVPRNLFDKVTGEF